MSVFINLLFKLFQGKPEPPVSTLKPFDCSIRISILAQIKTLNPVNLRLMWGQDQIGHCIIVRFRRWGHGNRDEKRLDYILKLCSTRKPTEIDLRNATGHCGFRILSDNLMTSVLWCGYWWRLGAPPPPRQSLQI